MIARSREKIALVVFFCLVFLGLGSLIGYLHLGHSWNVAASNIDDATGTMKGYVTILYEGTTPEDAKMGPEIDEELDDGIKDDDADIDDTDSDNSSGLYEDEIFSDRRYLLKDNEFGLDDDTESKNKEKSNNDVTTKKDPLGTNNPSFLDIVEVEKSYEGKQATVFTLDLSDTSKYYDGLILKKGSHRIGIFAAKKTDTPFKIEQNVKRLNRYAVDIVVVITPDTKNIQTVSGIDIVVSTKKEDLFIMGETRNNTFYVSSPTIGSVGAILISPSNVVSAKVLTEV